MWTLRRMEHPKENVVLTPSVAVTPPPAKTLSFQHVCFNIPARLGTSTNPSPMIHATTFARNLSFKCSARQYQVHGQHRFLPWFPVRSQVRVILRLELASAALFCLVEFLQTSPFLSNTWRIFSPLQVVFELYS